MTIENHLAKAIVITNYINRKLVSWRVPLFSQVACTSLPLHLLPILCTLCLEKWMSPELFHGTVASSLLEHTSLLHCDQLFGTCSCPVPLQLSTKSGTKLLLVTYIEFNLGSQKRNPVCGQRRIFESWIIQFSDHNTTPSFSQSWWGGNVRSTRTGPWEV